MNNLSYYDLNNPFDYRHPVKPEFFIVKEEIIKKILRYLNKFHEM